MKRIYFSAIYAIFQKSSGKIYVGSAVKLQKRWDYHRSNLQRNTHCNEYLQNTWNKYGPEDFEWLVLEVVQDVAKLIETEQYWIDYCQACDRKKGFNITPTAGSSLGVRLSEETKLKLMGRNKGFKQTEKQKQAVSQALKGNKHGANSHYHGVLSESDVKIILERCANMESFKTIADDFKVTRATINRIAIRAIWFNVQISQEMAEKLASRKGHKIKSPLPYMPGYNGS
jgi:group I intron endonuclease